MEYYYKGKKTTKDITEAIADLLEDHEFNITGGDMELFIEMCEKNELPKRYFTENILDFDKIIDDEEYIEEVIIGYSIKKYNY